ncbi:hypothetical protein LOTGIDRAFT_158510 [Lottia gigantea]|uniref:G-protein coupled receptors family 1 profile domain-containing protein n=1 Tax=Lottia gigantea TaxID=225164 RepID=V4CC30_LOTGI|nr:hypothetical protein LOTGIDRAFT_158510 [Lottia gigantea]ESO99424.1 hypothetical protein LOTGIDRAFT_158510 [Lottia gigantea]
MANFIFYAVVNSLKVLMAIYHAYHASDIIRNGYRIPFTDLPCSEFLINNRSAIDNSEFVGSAIQDLEKRGLISIGVHCSLQKSVVPSLIIHAFYNVKWAHFLVSAVSPTDNLTLQNVLEAGKRRLARPEAKKESITPELLNLMYGKMYVLTGECQIGCLNVIGDGNAKDGCIYGYPTAFFVIHGDFDSAYQITVLVLFGDGMWSNTTVLEYENPDKPLLVAFGIVCGVLAVLITLLNGALMIVILLKRKLRSSPKYFIVLNLSIVGFIDGAFLSPIQALGWNEWNFSCFIMTAAETMASAFIYLELMLIISMCIQWIVSITIPSYNAKTRFRLVLFLVSVSWLSSFSATLVYIIPGSRAIYIDQRCIFFLEEFARIGLLLTIPVPLLLISFITLVLLIVVRVRQRRCRYNLEANGKKFPLDIVLSALVLLLCITSSTIIQNVRYILLAIILIIILARSRHVLIPLIWLIMSKPIRRVVLCKGEETLTKTHDVTPMEQK